MQILLYRQFISCTGVCYQCHGQC